MKSSSHPSAARRSTFTLLCAIAMAIVYALFYGEAGSTNSAGPPDDKAVNQITATATWTGAINTNWDAAGNWSPNQVPISTSDVIIQNVSNQPTISASNPTINSLALDALATLTLSGHTLTITGATASHLTIDGTISGGTVRFGAGTHTISGSGSCSADNTVTVLSGATVTEGSNLHLGGLTINSGGSFGASNRSLTLTGDLTNDGTFTSSGSVLFNGSGAQTVSRVDAFNNVSVNNASGVTLNDSATVGSALSLTNGVLDIGTTTLTLNGPLGVSAGSIGSDVTGTVIYNQATGGQPVAPGSYGNLTFSNAAKILSQASRIRIAGTFNPGTAPSHTVTGSTVEYNGNSAQSLPTGFTTYNNLNINNTAGVTGFAGLVVQGLLDVQAGTFTSSGTFNRIQIDSGATLAGVSGTTLNVSGNWTNHGTFTANGNTVNFNGASAQTLTTSSSPGFNNLTINNSADVTLAGNTSVAGVLGVAAGDLVTGTYTLTMPAGASSSGSFDVVGSVQRTGFVTGGSALSFGNPFNTIRIDSGTAPTSITIILDKAVPTTPEPFSTAIARKYTIMPAGGSGYSTTVRLHYQNGDLNGNAEGAGLNLWRHDGNNWIKVGQTANSTTNNWVEKSGVTQFSPWTMNSSVPTAVDLATFQATGYDGGTLIEWQTGFEAANLGFNLYRDEAGKRVPVNQQLVAGSALLTGADTVLRAGRAYAFWDSTASKDAGAVYWLEDVALNGQSTWHGPCSSTYAGGAAPSRRNSPFLGQTTPAEAGRTRPLERPATLPRAAERLNATANLKAGRVASSLEPAGQAAVKLWVQREGWYSVEAAELLAAGFDPNANASLLQLYVDGRQVPINVINDKQGRFAAIAFYGRGIEAASTDKRVYWLVAGTQPGLRIPQVKGEGYPGAAASFLATVERKDRTIYFSSLRNGDRENFFGAVVATQPVEQTLTLRHVDESASGPATVEVALQGVTMQPHRVWVYVNGDFAGELFFEGQAAGAASFNLPQSLLRSGDNDVKLVAQGGPSDVSLIDYIRFSYWHRLTADDNALGFMVPGNQAVTIDGFTDGAIRVFDVTDADAVQELAAKIEAQKRGYAVTAASPVAGERRLLAIADVQAGKPARIAANQASSWRSPTNGADLIIIIRRDLSASLQPLVALRQSQGLKTSLVDVEDIYDEFSFGDKSPRAVKDFLGYATTSWKIKPRYVLLAGDASYDAKNYLGQGDWDLVPTRLIDTQLMEAASDDWLADFDDDGISDLAIGRLPARTAQEAGAMVEKIIGYERAEASTSILLVADSNDGYDFEAAANGLRDLIPGNLGVEQINRGRLDAAEARRRLLEAIAQGQKVINYTGHGSVNLWRGELLTNEDAQQLTNSGRLPVFVMMTCLNGYYDDPGLDSLAESLLKAERGGAVAVWASSGMTMPDGQAAINQQLYRLMFGAAGQSLRLGEATARAKSAAGDADIRRTWVLLGDPTMKLR